MDKSFGDICCEIIKDHGQRIERLQELLVKAQHGQGDRGELRRFLKDCIDTAENDNATIKALYRKSPGD